MSYVLIVDDDTNAAESMLDIVELLGHSAVAVHSPRQAIIKLQESLPSLILLDMNMPGVNGLEVCRYIKRDPLSGHTPVIFVSAEDDPTRIQAAYDAGASGYLIKPIELEELETMLLEIIKS